MKQKLKIARRQFLLLLLSILPMLANTASAQSCSTPIPLTINTCDTVVANDTTLWLSFNSGSGTSWAQINIIAPPNGLSQITSAELYSGACNSLTLVQTGLLEPNSVLIRSDIISSTNYLVKLTLTGPSNTALRVYSNVLASPGPCPVCTTDGCQLICNPTLEDYSWLNSDQHVANFVAGNVCDWTNAGNSSDFFTLNANDVNVQVPTNFTGTESAHSGNSYAGIFCFYGLQVNYREYIQQQLQAPLVANQKYSLSFWVSLSDFSGFGIANLGAHFSAGQPVQIGGAPLLNTPQVVCTTVVTTVQGWVQITGSFTANGTEQWITIGSFETDNVQQRTFVNPTMNNLAVTNPNLGSYYYIDDITLERVPDPCFTWQSACNSVNFFNTTSPCDQNIIGEWWDFGDPASGPNNTSTSANPSHTFTQNNYWYTVYHTIQISNGEYFNCGILVKQEAPPVANISGWATNNCGVGTMTYSASPCDPNIQYTWTVTNGTPSSGTGCSINVDWLALGGSIMLTALDPTTGCSTSVSLEIPPCCHGPELYINNLSAQQILNNPPAQLSLYVNGNTVDATLGPQPPPTLVIQGVFNVNTPITFINWPLIEMGGNTPVLVQPGKSITFSKCTLDVCGNMWDGIYVNDPTASATITNNCVVRQAKNVIVSNNGGNFLVENSKLESDYKGIVVNAYNGTHPGRVTNTDFTMTNPFQPAIPAFPFGHDETVCGIEITGNANVKIGDETSLAYTNRFTNILVGVRSKGSSTTIVNAAFNNLQPNFSQSFVPNAGTAIVSIGGRSFLYPLGLKVGGSLAFQRCSFNDMRIAVDCYDPHNVDVISNNITKIKFGFAVRIQGDRSSIINVNNNFIANTTSGFPFQTAIQMTECYQSTIWITSNTIRQNIAMPNQNGTGIKVSLVTPGDVILNVVSNTIERVKTGIWTQNLIGKQHVFITSNTINFQKPNANYTSVHYGIRLENCATVRVRYNVISKTSPLNPTAVMVNNLRGISFENSPTSIIAHNTLNKMGSGIYGWEVCSGSSLSCNVLASCWDGFFFTGGPTTGFKCDIGDQLINPSNFAPAPTGNTWSSINRDIAGGIFPTITWYETVTPSLSLAPVSMTNGNSTTFSANPSGCTIVQFITPGPGVPVVEREQNAGQPVLNPNAYASGSQQGYQGRRTGHRALRETPSWMSLGTPQDGLYAGFYTTNENTNIGLFRNFEEMAAVDSVQAAGNILTSINDTNISETNLKVVYSIYQQTWMQGVYAFSSADSATLYNIAFQHASDGSEAVYAARVMLNLQVDEYAANSQRLSEGEEFTDESAPSKVDIYPNPANEIVNGSIELEEGQEAIITITDLQGKVVLSQTTMVSGVFSLDVSSLAAGMYFMQTSVDGELIETNKLKIIHE